MTTLKVLGKEPKPGHHLGYMPQEIALYDEFTILETLQYFGRLHGLRSKEVGVEKFSRQTYCLLIRCRCNSSSLLACLICPHPRAQLGP